jgi:hypothetical protein
MIIDRLIRDMQRSMGGFTKRVEEILEEFNLNPVLQEIDTSAKHEEKIPYQLPKSSREVYQKSKFQEILGNDDASQNYMDAHNLEDEKHIYHLVLHKNNLDTDQRFNLAQKLTDSLSLYLAVTEIKEFNTDQRFNLAQKLTDDFHLYNAIILVPKLSKEQRYSLVDKIQDGLYKCMALKDMPQEE